MVRDKNDDFPRSQRTIPSQSGHGLMIEEDGSSNSNKNRSDDIRVAIRMRPLSQREMDMTMTSSQRSWKVLKEHNSIVQLSSDGLPIEDGTLSSGTNSNSTGSKVGSTSVFTYDGVFTEEDSTKQVYDYIAKGMVEAVIQGRNASIFSYGQTSSGKTYTMQGPGSVRDGMKEREGLLHLVAADLFREVENCTDRQFFISVSVMEIYNEELRDLLIKSGSGSSKLRVREHKSTGVFVQGTTRREAMTYSKMIQWISYGERQRIVAETTLNERSSRSHLIFSIHIESNQITEKGSIQSSTRTSTFNLIDLAGSESVKHRSSFSSDRRSKEGGNINKSLLTLSLVIQSLASKKRNSHVNYRDSKLTRVLQHSLSGNALMGFVCCATPSSLFTEETKSTLKFASRIKVVKTNAKINYIDERTELERAHSEVSRMKDTILQITDAMKKLEVSNQKLKSTIQTLSMDRDRAVERIKLLEQIHRSTSSNTNFDSSPKGSRAVMSSNQIRTSATRVTPTKSIMKTNAISNTRMQPVTIYEDAPHERWDVPTEFAANSPTIISIVSEPSRYGDIREEMDGKVTPDLNDNPGVYSKRMDDMVSTNGSNSGDSNDPMLEYGSESEGESDISEF